MVHEPKEIFHFKSTQNLSQRVVAIRHKQEMMNLAL